MMKAFTGHDSKGAKAARGSKLLIFALALFALLLLSCSPTAQPVATRAVETVAPPAPAATLASPTLVPKTELTIVDALPSVTLDPHKDGHTPLDNQVVSAIHDGLIGFKNGVPGADFEPRLATSWKISQDGLTWTFELRKGVVWQKGNGAFTSADVVYTFDRLKDPKRSLNSGLVDGVLTSVKAIDDFTVEFKLAGPVADFVPQFLLFYRTASILSKKAVEAIGDDKYALNPVGTGPYQVVERIPGQRTVLERNPTYWGKAPDVARFTILDIPEESVRADALVAAKIDIGSFRSPPVIKSLVNNQKVKVSILNDRPCLWTLYISESKVPDVRVREAIARSINKKELAETVLQFRSNPQVVSLQAPLLPGFPKDKKDELYPYSPDRSKALLAEAGLKPGDLTLKFVTRTDFVEMSQAIKGYLEAVGIKSNIDVQEQAAFRQTLRTKGKDYDIVPSNPSRSTATQFLAFYGQESATSQYETGVPPKVVELYNAQSKELDPAKREKLISDLLNIVEKDIPWVPFGICASAATGSQPWISAPFVNFVDEFVVPFGWIKIDQDAYAKWAKTR